MPIRSSLPAAALAALLPLSAMHGQRTNRSSSSVTASGAPTLAIVLSGARGPSLITLITIAPSIVIGLPFLALAALFPTMRYELDADALTLRYGPVLRYRIPYSEIQGMQRRDLSVPVWSSMRLPGLALFVVPYNDVGPVRMCATRAAKDILLIRTTRATYGLTPAEERLFLDAIMARLPP